MSSERQVLIPKFLRDTLHVQPQKLGWGGLFVTEILERDFWSNAST